MAIAGTIAETRAGITRRIEERKRARGNSPSASHPRPIATTSVKNLLDHLLRPLRLALALHLVCPTFAPRLQLNRQRSLTLPSFLLVRTRQLSPLLPSLQLSSLLDLTL